MQGISVAGQFVFFNLQAFYLPWVMLALDLLLGNPLMPDILGIVAGHLYYFLTVLHPLAGGKYVFKTPLFVYPFYCLFSLAKHALKLPSKSLKPHFQYFYSLLW